MTPNDSQFWDKLMPVIGRLGDQQRALAFAHAMEAARGGDLDQAAMDRLLDELRQRFQGKQH